MVPNAADDQTALGAAKVTLFQTLRQSTSKTKDISRGREIFRCNAASKFWEPELLRLKGRVRGALPSRNGPAVALKALESTYGIALQPVPIPRLQAVVPFGPVP